MAHIIRPQLHRRERSPKIDHGVVVNMTPVQPTNIPLHVGVLVSVIHTKGPIIRRKESREMSVGKFYVLRWVLTDTISFEAFRLFLRADLQIDEHWGATNIVCPVGACRTST